MERESMVLEIEDIHLLNLIQENSVSGHLMRLELTTVYQGSRFMATIRCTYERNLRVHSFIQCCLGIPTECKRTILRIRHWHSKLLEEILISASFLEILILKHLLKCIIGMWMDIHCIRFGYKVKIDTNMQMQLHKLNHFWIANLFRISLISMGVQHNWKSEKCMGLIQ